MIKPKKNKKSSNKKLFEGDWCPLFGILPKISKSHRNYEIAHKYIGIIEQSRTHWGIMDHNMVDDPFPSIEDLPISLYREYTGEKYRAARLLFKCLDEIAWKTGPDGRNEIDKRALRCMVEKFCDVRQTLNEHLICKAQEKLNFPYKINLRELYSLFAIHEAWNMLSEACFFKLEHNSYFRIMKRLQKAEGLLDAADHRADLEEKELLHEELIIEKKKPSIYGSMNKGKDKKSFAIRAAINEILDNRGKDTSVEEIWLFLKRNHKNTQEKRAMTVLGDNGEKYQVWFCEDIEENEKHVIEQKPYDSYKKPIGRRAFENYVKFVKEERSKKVSQ